MTASLPRHSEEPDAIRVPVPSSDDLDLILSAMEAASAVLALTPGELTTHAVPSVAQEAQHNAIASMGEAITFLNAWGEIIGAARDRLATALETKGTNLV